MRTIYKYTINLMENRSAIQFVSMPKNANVISVGHQNGMICLWAEVEVENVAASPVTEQEDSVVLGSQMSEREFRIVGTGHEIPFDIVSSDYIGTVQVGPLVWHIYEKGRLKQANAHK